MKNKALQKSVGGLFALLGFGLFAINAGEIFLKHDSWQQAFSPHGVGDMLKAVGTAIVGVLGVMGVKAANKDDDETRVKTDRFKDGRDAR